MKTRFDNVGSLYSIYILLFLAALAGFMSPPAAAYCSYCNCTYVENYLPDTNGGGCLSSACYWVCAKPPLTAWNPQLAGI